MPNLYAKFGPGFSRIQLGFGCFFGGGDFFLDSIAWEIAIQAPPFWVGRFLKNSFPSIETSKSKLKIYPG